MENGVGDGGEGDRIGEGVCVEDKERDGEVEDKTMDREEPPPSDCPDCCAFHGVDDYSSTFLRLATEGSLLPLPQDPSSLLPALSLPLCLLHSPFVLLVRQLVSIELFAQLMSSPHASSLSLSRQLVASVFVMAGCSCLVWARYPVYVNWD